MNNEIFNLDEQYIMHTYKRFNVCFTHGNGAFLYDESGKEYVDFGSGIGVNCLGHNNAAWVSAIEEQLHKLAHISNLYYNEQAPKLAKMLCEKTGMNNVFFGNSGAEANEGAIKIARKYSFMKYGADAGRNKIISIKNSFHGRTLTTLSATGQDVFHNFFFPFTEGFVFADKEIDAIENAIDEQVCAIMFEVIQGEGGILPLQQEFVDFLVKTAAEKDLLLIVDEIQTGVGRTGKFLASEHYNFKPDIVTLAKGLAGGMPIGAVLCNEKTKDVFTYSDHGSTFGGNPLSCAAAIAVLEQIDGKFLDNVLEKGEYLRKKLMEELGGDIVEIRGKGLMLGVDLKDLAAGAVIAKAIDKGAVILSAKNSLRFLPPLVISKEQIDKGVSALRAAVEEIKE